MSETDLQRAILKALEDLGVWAIRIGSIGRRSGTGARSGEPGIPDIYLPRYNAWLEVKVDGGRLSQAQRDWHFRAQQEGVRVFTVLSVQEVLVRVKQLAAGA